MTITGLFFLPSPPSTTASNTPSIATILATHISLKHPTAQPLPPFTLDHRIFYSTSSLLPNSPPSSRQYTQFLTLPHVAPGQTFVGSSYPSSASSSNTQSPPTGSASKDANPAPPAPPMSIITVPTNSQPNQLAGSGEDLYELMQRKLQPLWSARQSQRVDTGVALSLRDGTWTVRLGDLWTSSSASAAATNRPSQVRGVVVEITLQHAHDAAVVVSSSSSSSDQQTLLTAFFHALVRDSAVPLDGLRVVVRPSLPAGGNASADDDDNDQIRLVRQYMEILRFR